MAKGGFAAVCPGGMNQATMMKQAQKMQQEMLQMQAGAWRPRQYRRRRPAAAWSRPSSTASMSWSALTIEPEAVDPDDVEMLQDMVVAAVNEAMRKAEAEAANNMCKLTGGLNLGGLF